MRAVVVTTPGPPEVLRVEDVPAPVAGPGEVVVDVVAAGVNRADLLQRQGFYPPPPGASEYLGLECSGFVSSVGDGVDASWVGRPVCALLSGGGYAEQVAVPVGQLLPIPGGVDIVTAAALPEVACTVWSNLVMTGGLRAGERLLIHGGASGIGTHAIQVARALGASVAVTAGTDERLARCGRLGAQLLVNHRDQDFVDEIRNQWGGVDVVLDIMGAIYLSRNVSVLNTAGRLVIIGLQGGTRAEVDLGLLLSKRASIHATTLRARPVDEKAAICRQVVEHVWPMIEAGQVVPVVDRVVPLAAAATAHVAVESSDSVGKVLLAVT